MIVVAIVRLDADSPILWRYPATPDTATSGTIGGVVQFVYIVTYLGLYGGEVRSFSVDASQEKVIRIIVARDSKA